MNILRFLVVFLILSHVKDAQGQGCSAISVRVSPSPTSQPKRDTTVCKGASLNLSVSVPTLRSTTSYTVNSIPYIDTLPCESSGSLVAGSGITLDDAYSAVQNIGFNFCFFGTQRSQVQICDNGFLTFSTNKPVASSLSAPYIPRKLPLLTHPNPAASATTLPPNSILGAWMDVFLETGSGVMGGPGGGSITTQVVGTAPFRAYIVKWNNCRYFATTCRSNPSMVLTMKIVLYETTNLIDIYIKSKPICSLSSTVLRYHTTQGIQGDSNFKFLLSPGRDSSIWDGANSAIRFTPNGATSTATIQWSKNGVTIGTNTTTSISATDDSALYIATATFNQPCPTGSFIARDTMKVIGLNNEVQTFHINDTMKCISQLTLNASNATALSYRWENGATTPTRVVTNTGVYHVVRTYHSLGCRRDTIFYHIKKYAFPKIDSVRRFGCFNSLMNGQIQIYASGDTSQLRYGQTSIPSNVSNTLTNQKNGTAIYWIRNAGGCKDSITMVHDSMSATYSKRVNYCDQDSSGMMRLKPSGGNSPYIYSLTGRTSQNIDSFNKITSGIYTIQVSDKNGCTIQRTDTIIPFTNLALSIVIDSVKCFGDSSGRIVVSLNGGLPGYLYSIQNSTYASSGTFNKLTSGAYLIRTKDAANCPIDTTLIVSSYPVILSNIVKSKTCPYHATAILNISASGGLPDYNFRLNGGAFQSNSSFSGLNSGSFSYSIRDKNNCIRTWQDSIQNFSKPKLALAMKRNTSCYSVHDGKIKMTTVAGTVPYSYSWSVAGTADSLSNLPAANYTGYVSDSNNCRDTLLVSISQPDSLHAIFSLKNPSCHGYTDGSVKITGLGGTKPYTYSLNTTSFVTSDSFSNIASGSYSFTIRDSQWCQKTYSHTLSSPSPLGMTIVIDSVKCHGDLSGKVLIIPSGGTPGYVYKANSQIYDTSNIKTNLAAGINTISIKDSNGCSLDSFIAVPTYSKINISIILLDTIRCKNGSDGRISINASGGQASYTYSINGGLYQSSPIFSNLNTGWKYISIKDANNCVVIDSILMKEPPGMVGNVNIVNHASCYGFSDAKARVVVNGGSPPYTYLWSNNVVLDSTHTLNKGAHFVKLTDNRNCKDSISFIINQPDSIHANFILHHPKCYDSLGSIKILPTGGTSPYLFALGATGTFSSNDSFTNLKDTVTIRMRDSKGCSKVFRPHLITPPILSTTYHIDSVKCFGGNSGKITITHSGGTGTRSISYNGIPSLSDTIKGLISGNYLVNVIDINNCSLDSLLFVPQFPDISINTIQDTVLCYGASSGKIAAAANGGKPGYSYAINSGVFGSNNIFTDLPAGAHTIKIRDANLCEKSKSVLLTQLDSLVANTWIVNNPCHKDSLGMIKLSPTGGTAPYQFSFLGSPFDTKDSISMLPAGIHTYSIRDKNNCVKSGTAAITHPPALRVSAIIDSVKCYKQNTGKVQLVASGGVGGYRYSWDGLVYSSVSVYTDLASKWYPVKVRDSNLCTKDTTTLVPSSDSFYFSYRLDSIDCFNANNGKITLTPIGGKPPYQYQLNSGSYGPNNIIANLSPSNHSVRMRDAYNCELRHEFTLLNPNPIVISTDSIRANSCHGEAKGLIQISSSGGRMPHTYLWSNGSNTSTIQNLVAGSYTITVKDDKNCIATKTEAIAQPNPFTISILKNNLKCYGDADGKLSLSVTGATAPYSYAWTTGAVDSAITNLVSGNYSVTIIDKNMCSTVRSENIIQPDSISFQLIKTNSHCAASMDGSITISNLRGGTTPDSYQWSHGANTMNVSQLAPFSLYTVTVVDRNGCSKLQSTFIDTQYVLRIKIDTLGIPRCPDSRLNMQFTPLNGTPPYQYRFGKFENSSGIYLNLENMPYSYIVRDQYNCIDSGFIDLVPRDTMKIKLNLYPPPCDAANVFPVSIKVYGGKAPYAFDFPGSEWSQGDSARYSHSGTYPAKVRDDYGCTVDRAYSLRLPDGALSAKIIKKKNLRCYKSNDGVLHVQPSGGYSPYTLLWNTGDTNSKLQQLPIGEYNVQITDAGNCVYTLYDTISQPDSLYFHTLVTDLICVENPTGKILINASGGSKHYVYSIDTAKGYSLKSNFNSLEFGKYNVNVRDDSACIASQTILVDVKYKLTVALDSIFQLTAGDRIHIMPTLNLLPENTMYTALWSSSEGGVSCTDCLSTEFNGYVSSLLNLNIRYGEGCHANFKTHARVESTAKDELYIPNAFSPHAEHEENKQFKAYANRVLKFEMQIFNRWGEKIFESNHIQDGWDGKYKGELAPAGMYSYYVKVTKLDGIKIVKSGEFSLF